MSDMDNTSFFGSGALFQGKGGQPVFEEPARHRPRQGRGWLDHMYTPCHPSFVLPTEGQGKSHTYRLLSSDE